MVDRKAQINWDECTECGVCRRAKVCSADAIYQQPLEWPRSVRAVYSDPLNIHKETGLAGRGTEEIKTNDVTGRFKRGEIGIAIEVGRPNVGAKLRELERFSIALVEKGIAFEPRNPLTNLIDAKTGKLPAEILDEKVISAIIEFAVPEKNFIPMLKLIDEVARDSKTVISVDAAVRAAEDGSWPTVHYLKEAGYYYRPNCKTNVGLGKL
jgi:ferredoxin